MLACVIIRIVAAALLLASIGAAGQQQVRGRSDPSFSQPSLPADVDYTLPTEAEVKSTLDRILIYLERSTRYQIVDSQTGDPVTDLSRPVQTAGIGDGEFNDWTYSTGVVLAGMLQVSDATGDARFQDYSLTNFSFIFDHLDYFRAQAKQFGPQPRGYRRLLDMRELDDCEAMGAALIKASGRNADSRYRGTIDIIAEFISHRQMRIPDGTLARPQPVSLWVDDLIYDCALPGSDGASHR